MTDYKIKRALLSVTDKTGIVPFARALVDEFGVELISTGGTHDALVEAGIPVTSIDRFTGFPEILDGRVKTLHPRVHGGLLAQRDVVSHMAEVTSFGIALIDMVVVNLYAFARTVARVDVTREDAIERIDIGGPSMLRSAAKNHERVTVVSDVRDYDAILAEMRERSGATTLATRARLATKVFGLTSSYDAAIFEWLSTHEVAQASEAAALVDANTAPQTDTSDAEKQFPAEMTLHLQKIQDLRYGENPHQPAAFYKQVGAQPPTLACARQIQGKELSYNNIQDADACWAAVRDLREPACVIVKHMNPCGAAIAKGVAVAYRHAYQCDPVSAYGGVMAFNRIVTPDLVQAIFDNNQFVEVMIAPNYKSAARELLATKPNLRVLETGGMNFQAAARNYKSVEGGMLVQERDVFTETPKQFSVVSKRQPTADEMEQLWFAWRVAKSVKSNAILLVKDGMTVGVGAGQPNRVNSARIACGQAGKKARGAVAASDAFMPFADSLEVCAEAGVTAVIQPGGSIRDEEVIAAANASNMALVFTGHRHFRH